MGVHKLENYRNLDISDWDSGHRNTPKFKFPTEHPHHINPIDEVINNVKKVVTEVASSVTTTDKPCEITTILSESTTPMIELTQNTNSSIMDIAVNTNSTIMDIAVNTNNTMISEMMNTNSSLIDIGVNTNNTMVNEMIDTNATVTEIVDVVNATLSTLNNTGGEIDELTTTEQIATTLQAEVSSETTRFFDWSSRGTDEFINHNLTMMHDGDVNENGQTLYVILGVILGVLVAIAFILFLIYLSYKRSNLYTLQEQASCTSSRVVSKTTVQYTKDAEQPQDICSSLE